jgi:hypothetical protein
MGMGMGMGRLMGLEGVDLIMAVQYQRKGKDGLERLGGEDEYGYMMMDIPRYDRMMVKGTWRQDRQAEEALDHDARRFPKKRTTTWVKMSPTKTVRTAWEIQNVYKLRSTT